jgi:hypothetical protein
MTPLTLRDVHEGTAPPWWPPAPGWWMVLACLVLVALVVAWRRRRSRLRAAAVLRVFDDAIAAATTPSQQVAAMSELLRRAARRRHPGAGSLQGAEWTALLDDGLDEPLFSAGAGRLLLEGGFRGDVAATEADALRDIARTRYLAWMRDA